MTIWNENLGNVLLNIVMEAHLHDRAGSVGLYLQTPGILYVDSTWLYVAYFSAFERILDP